MIRAQEPAPGRMSRLHRRLGERAVVTTLCSFVAIAPLTTGCATIGTLFAGAKPAPPSPAVPAGSSTAPAATAIQEVPGPVAVPALTPPAPRVANAAPARVPPEALAVEYRLGVDDEIEVSVYGESELSKTQTVRPGGKISFPIVGDVQAADLTPDDLRARLTERLANFIKSPRVTVIVTKYNSRRVSILGEVKEPGLLRMSAPIDVLEALSRAGGLTEEADLQSALLVRGGQMVPVDFETLLRHGDFTHNVILQPQDVVLIPNVRDKKVFVLGQVSRPSVVALRNAATIVESISRAGGLTDDADLRGTLLVRDGKVATVNFERLLKEGDLTQNLALKPNDVILVPNIKDKKVFVLGEVARPLVVPLRPGTTLVELIAAAGGFTRDASKRSVMLVRGGLSNPSVETVNMNDIVDDGDLTRNLVLQPNDIVVVPKTIVSNVVRFFQDLSAILTPLILAETGIVLGPAVHSVLTTGRTTETQPIVIGR